MFFPAAVILQSSSSEGEGHEPQKRYRQRPDQGRDHRPIPRIGEILNRYEIGCVTCGVGICLLKDVVAIHALGAEVEAQIEAEINQYLETAA